MARYSIVRMIRTGWSTTYNSRSKTQPILSAFRLLLSQLFRNLHSFLHVVFCYCFFHNVILSSSFTLLRATCWFYTFNACRFIIVFFFKFFTHSEVNFVYKEYMCLKFISIKHKTFDRFIFILKKKVLRYSSYFLHFKLKIFKFKTNIFVLQKTERFDVNFTFLCSKKFQKTTLFECFVYFVAPV